MPGEVNNAWARIRKNLRESAGARLFEQWLKPIELGDSDDDQDDSDDDESLEKPDKSAHR